MISDSNFAEGHLVVMEHLGGAEFGDPWTLTEIDIMALDYYPVFSPDSRWVAYNRTFSRQTNFAEDAALWLVEAVEGATPIELERANWADGITNSWPRWGPVPDDDVFWLAFASNRDYGIHGYEEAAVDCPTGQAECEHAQIWISGIDTRIAEEGSDPSLPAYRFPQQDWLESNHAPLWSLY